MNVCNSGIALFAWLEVMLIISSDDINKLNECQHNDVPINKRKCAFFVLLIVKFSLI